MKTRLDTFFVENLRSNAKKILFGNKSVCINLPLKNELITSPSNFIF